MNKKFVICLFVIFFGAAFASNAAAAGWKLYDNFNNGFNADKWWKLNDNGKIYVANGKLVIKHLDNGNMWAGVKQHLSQIRGIRADVKVEKCQGEQRARVGGWIANWGKSGGSKQLFAVTEMRPYGSGSDKRMGGFAGIDKLDANGQYLEYIRDESWGGMPVTGSLWGKWRKLTLRWDNSKKWVEWKDGKLNRIQRFFPTNIKLPQPKHKLMGIQTRRDGTNSGTCTVRIDNVYLYR